VADGLLALGRLDALVGVTDDAGADRVDVVEGEVRERAFALMLERVAGVPVRLEPAALFLEPLGNRRDEAGHVLRVPLEALAPDLVRLLLGGRAVHHRERRGLVVDELAGRPGALRETL